MNFSGTQLDFIVSETPIMLSKAVARGTSAVLFRFRDTPRLTLPGTFALMCLILLFVTQLPAWGAGFQSETKEFPVAEMREFLDEQVLGGKSPAAFCAFGGPDIETVILCSGQRQSDHPETVESQDLVHIGSCTKAMTAVLVGRLVDRGLLNWDDTIAMRLPELANQIAEPYRHVTLTELLSHTGHIPANANNWWTGSRGKITDARNRIILATLAELPAEGVPDWSYSNLGFMIAGQMAAEVGGATWEELIRSEVFEPLGMKSPGFGPPGNKSDSSQPKGHVFVDEKFTPVYADNAPALGPAGTVHLSLEDWVRFCNLFCGGGPEDFLKQDSLDRLVTVVRSEYAMGWTVTRRGWGDGTVLTHSGSNTYWTAYCWVAPRTKRVYLSVVNHASESAAETADRIVARLIELERKTARAK